MKIMKNHPGSRRPAGPALRRFFSLAAAAVAGAPLLLAAAAAAEPVLTGGPPAFPPRWETDFSALWSEAAPATTLYVADDLPDLIAHMAAAEAEGLRLAAFESWPQSGIRRYAGLFRPGTDHRFLFTGMDAAAFEARRLQQAAHGLRLLDLEVRLEDGVRRYSGLWSSRATSFAEQVRDGADPATFAAQAAALAPHYALAIFDTWREDGELRVYGVFRSGLSPVGVSVGLSWPEFGSELAERAFRGERLVDFDIAPFPEAGDLFSARWKTTAPAADWLGIYFRLDWLIEADGWLGAGHEFSGIGESGGGFLPAPTADPKYLLDLEVGRDLVSGPINQAKPLHDSGTPGPPKTWP